MRGSFLAALAAVALLALPPLAIAGPLYDAANKGDVGQIRQLVATGADLGERDAFGTPLHHAAARGHPEAVTVLLELGADPNALAGRARRPGERGAAPRQGSGPEYRELYGRHAFAQGGHERACRHHHGPARA